MRVRRAWEEDARKITWSSLESLVPFLRIVGYWNQDTGFVGTFFGMIGIKLIAFSR